MHEVVGLKKKERKVNIVVLNPRCSLYNLSRTFTCASTHAYQYTDMEKSSRCYTKFELQVCAVEAKRRENEYIDLTQKQF